MEKKRTIRRRRGFPKTEIGILEAMDFLQIDPQRAQEFLKGLERLEGNENRMPDEHRHNDDE